MDTCRPCGCKGCRTCLLCEKEYGIDSKKFITEEERMNAYIYCPFCNKAWPGWDMNDYQKHPNHIGNSIDFPGIYIQLNFLTEDEEYSLMKGVDSMEWNLSQSGRRKQNFGPKCNFKKRKLRIANFEGFPKFSKFVQDKFNEVPILKGFRTIEQCSLEYDPNRGACIDPHIDDCWIWGERIVTVNLLSDSVLTMTFNDKHNRYNLECVNDYPMVLDNFGSFNNSDSTYKIKTNCNDKSYIVRIPMPNRSLLVMYNSARYDWEHQILREDLINRRVCLAYREFTPPYLIHGDKRSAGNLILEKALNFF